LRAVREGDGYRLFGEKTSTTFSDSADAFLVFARTGPESDAAKAVTAFLVPAGGAGLTSTRFRDVGSHMSGRGSLFFDGVRVGVDNRLGEEGRGFSEVMAGFDYSRALIALQCIGAAQASIDEAWAYTKEREAFGGPIAQFQGVTFPLVEGETQLAAGRQLAYHTLALRDAGRPHTVEAAMIKWFGPRTAFEVTHQCLLTFGHYGWSMDLPHQQRLRDVMGLEIGDGTCSRENFRAASFSACWSSLKIIRRSVSYREALTKTCICECRPSQALARKGDALLSKDVMTLRSRTSSWPNSSGVRSEKALRKGSASLGAASVAALRPAAVI